MREESVPKAGVYAVRQGPVVWENIHRYLEGKPLQEYHPQRSFLKLINLGDGRAVGQWKRFGFSGRWVMRLKHRIDNTFMEKFQIGSMTPESDTRRSSDRSMAILDDELSQQCRGCGCKLGSETLAAAFDPDSPIGFEDAAEITRTGDESWIASTDFFSFREGCRIQRSRTS
jgi:selenide,water dikinase